ncbi:MAG TPA: STAS domain-containing protein [Burkholderiales bacterium]|nr:STAS domain-containing protein [Burkholderiales bacterium]
MDIKIRNVGDVVVFEISGDFTRTDYAVPTLHDLTSAQLHAGKRNILFDFDKTEFVDSFGVGQIIASYTSTTKLGGGFKICSVPRRLLLVLTIVGLVPRVLSVYRNEAAALESFAHPS